MQALIRFVVCAAIGVAACGDGGSNGGDGQGGMGGYGVELPTAESFYPQKVGNSWTYLVTPVVDVDLPSYKIVTIDALETVGGEGASAGRPAFRHTTCKSAPTVEACSKPASDTNRIDKNIGWMGMNGLSLANYREQAFKRGTDMLVEEDWWVPSRLKIDMSPAHTMAGATWTDTYKEFKHPTAGKTTTTTQNEKWTVLAVGETVTITPPTGPPRTYPNCIKLTHDNNSGSMTKTFWYARGIGKVKESGAQIEELIDYKVQP